MTNYEKWQLYMREVTSPQRFIDFGWIYIVAAALGRKVWVGGHRKLYPNVYIILVGGPGVGKGLVIKPVTDILKHFRINMESGKIEEHKENIGLNTEEVDADYIEAIQQANARTAGDYNPSARRVVTPKLVIPVAADSATFQALLQEQSRATRRMN